MTRPDLDAAEYAFARALATRDELARARIKVRELEQELFELVREAQDAAEAAACSVQAC